jgi:DUF4097 and DUF4098 domain-containing protein YvlB
MKPKEFILLVFLVVAGVLFTQLQTGQLDWDIYLGEDIFFPQDVFTHLAVEEVEGPIPAAVEIISPDGSVRIESLQSESVRIKLEKRIRHNSEAEAARLAQSLKIIVDQKSEKMIISTNRDDLDYKRFEADFSIELPSECRVAITEAAGDVRVFGVREADISSRYGDVTAAQIKTNLSIKNRHHTIDVDQVGGRCSINSSGSDIKVQRVEGGTTITTEYGRIDLENIANGVELSCPQTRVTARSIKGRMEIESSYKSIRLQDTGPVKINAKQADITASGINGGLEIKNQYARIQVACIKGPVLDIRGKSIAIEADDIDMQEIYVSSSYRDISISDFTGKTTVIHSNGKVSLYPEGLSDSITVQGDISDIYLYWPRNQKLWLSAQAERGKVNWNYPAGPEIRIENGHTLKKSFSGDAPQHLISLFTKYGTIWVEPAGEN